MDKSKKGTIAAVIDIGSNSLKMLIAQLSAGKIKVLEELISPVSLGKDTFKKGRISFSRLNKACDILNKFVRNAESYGLKAASIETAATTAVREAENSEYILDQIKIRTGLSVHVLDDSAEKTIIYKELSRKIEASEKYKSPTLMVYIGAGNLGIALYDNGIIPLTLNIRLGSLRLSEMLSKLRERGEESFIILEDYLRSFNETVKNILPGGEINHFVASGREILMIAGICKAKKDGNFYYIPRESFLKLYCHLTKKPDEELLETYALSEEELALLKPAVSIYNMLLKFTTAEKITASETYITDGLIFRVLCPEDAAKLDKKFEKSAYISTKALASRYNYDKTHSEFVEKYALKIFDKTRRLHRLGDKERLLLQLASVLHDIGKFVSIRNHYNHSFEIIRGSEISGLDSRDTKIIANIARYHSTTGPSANDESYRGFGPEERMVISKLAAILRIAEALDKGHAKKFEDIEVRIKDNTLIIEFTTLDNTSIEEMFFDAKKGLFEEVFGMSAVIKKRRRVT